MRSSWRRRCLCQMTALELPRCTCSNCQPSSPWIRGAPHRGFASAIVRIKVRMSAVAVGRPSRRRLFRVHQSRKPCRCQAMTVSGLTRTSAVRHPAQTRASMTQNHRPSSRAGLGAVGCAAARQAGAARPGFRAREYDNVRSVSRSERSTETMSEKRTQRRPQHQLPQQERSFQQGSPTGVARSPLPVTRRTTRLS